MSVDLFDLRERMATALAVASDPWVVEKLGNLSTSLARYGSFSDAQIKFAESLILRANGHAAPQQQRDTVDLGSFSAMVGLFDRAAGNVRAPKVSLRVKDAAGTTDFELSLAGENARQPGTINVATPGKFGEADWFGRILRDGRFEQSPRTATPTRVIEMLRAFAEHPLQTVKNYGLLTGSCALCRRRLTDAKSIVLGVGPVCARRFNIE